VTPDSASLFVYWTNQGVSRLASGDRQSAIKGFLKARAVDPTSYVSYNNVGHIHHSNGDSLRGRLEYTRAALCDPHIALAWIGLGLCCVDKSDSREAPTCFARAVVLSPDNSQGYGNLAVAIQASATAEARAAILSRGHFAQPDDFLPPYNLGQLHLTETEDLPTAFSFLQKALSLNPGSAQTLCNLGVYHRDTAQPEIAAICFYRSRYISPLDAETNWNIGLLLLAHGKYLEGWAQYEKRHALRTRQRPPLTRTPILEFGTKLNDKKILVYTEQGLGDAIQFARFVYRLNSLGARVTLQVPDRLCRLMKESDLPCEILSPRESHDDKTYDFQVSALSLPHRLSLIEERSFAAEIPFLRAEPSRIEKWRQVIDPRKLRIGIAWQGRKSRIDLGRSFPLSELSSIASLNGVQLVCLQGDSGIDQLAPFSHRDNVLYFGDELDRDGAFIDTVAIMKSLDLVITPDTSIAHVAGTLGIPVWIALSAAPDWRWGFHGDFTPWYPTARLFRQDTLGKWEPVFDRMIASIVAKRL